MTSLKSVYHPSTSQQPALSDHPRTHHHPPPTTSHQHPLDMNMRIALTTTATWFLAADCLTQASSLSFVSQRCLATTKASKTLLASSGDGRHSYVEGASYDDRMAEIEALGGDPFFLMDEENVDSEEDSSQDQVIPSPSFMSNLANLTGDPVEEEEKRYSTDGKGPTPKSPKKTVSAVEWDGTVDEDAHLGFD